MKNTPYQNAEEMAADILIVFENEYEKAREDSNKLEQEANDRAEKQEKS